MLDETGIIQLEGLSYKIGYRYLLKDINWLVKPGEHWVVFGMNGSGKTTLLSIVAGFKPYSAGRLYLFGEAPTEENILAYRQRIGWVSASFFDKYYTKEAVMDIVLSGKYGTLGVESDITISDRKRARDLLNELGLARQADYSFDMLSKGERQNVLIARALFTKPEILILDEPCAGLDIYNREYLFRTLEQLSEQKTLTIIYVTHYVEEILPLFDKCLLLKQGHIFLNAPTDDAFTSEVFSQFLDHPAEISRAGGQIHLTIQQIESRLTHLI